MLNGTWKINIKLLQSIEKEKKKYRRKKKDDNYAELNYALFILCREYDKYFKDTIGNYDGIISIGLSCWIHETF